MRTSGNVSVDVCYNAYALTTSVFRAAHDSAKSVRTWMADLQKK